MKTDLTAIRRELFQRKRGRCEYCKQTMAFEDSTLDHWVPKAMGGTNQRNNLILACEGCNNKKASMTPWEWMTRDKQPTEGGLR